jgi:tRNA-splicing ligase RtcB
MKIFGSHEAGTIAQLETCVKAEDGARGVLCADGHIGYSMPIGGVVGYRNYISPSGVGYDIACGNLAVKTDLNMRDLTLTDQEHIANDIVSHIEFGVGGKNKVASDHGVIEAIRHADVPLQRSMASLAAAQLGTVGSGNHYVDILRDAFGAVWIACHFGSRGFGHKTATGFLNLAANRAFDDRGNDGEMFSPPVLLNTSSTLGLDYIHAMQLAGAYAYAGREAVIAVVLDILKAKVVDTVHNHHNFAWSEVHDGTDYWVVRKGATPAAPGQRGFVGGSMGDISVILHGVDSEESRASLYSTVHGAGRLMSRNQAKKGKHEWRCPACGDGWIPPRDLVPKNGKCPACQVVLKKMQLTPAINFRDVQDHLKAQEIVLRGAGADEAPAVYRQLSEVLGAHRHTVVVETILHPVVVVMAGADVKDPYKD